MLAEPYCISFILTAIIGFSIAFGIFQEYYSTAPGLVGDKSNVANIGTATTVRLPKYLYFAQPKRKRNENQD